MPRGELRRKDRGMAAPAAEQCMARALVGHVGTAGPGSIPYVVPMNFVYDPNSRTIFLHCATSGQLLDNLAHNPLVCFEVAEPGEVIATGLQVCNTSQIYRSVICFGRARVLTQQAEREEALRLFVRKYVDQLTPERRYDPTLTMLEATTVIAIEVEGMTGKERAAG